MSTLFETFAKRRIKMFRCKRCGGFICGKGADKCPSCEENPILQKNEITDISPKAWRKMIYLDKIAMPKKKNKEKEETS